MPCEGCGAKEGKDAQPEVEVERVKGAPVVTLQAARPDRPIKQNLLRGALQMGRVKMGGRIDGKIEKMRLAVCATCKEQVKDRHGKDTGELLFRHVNETPYCGAPWHNQLSRLPYHEGCGCNLNDKTQWKKSECPRALWGPGADFGRGIVAVYDNKSKGTLKNVIDMHIMSKDNPPDISGIGDTLSFLPMVRAMRTANPDKQVRYVVMKGNRQWAELGYDDIVFEDDIERVPGETQFHSADPGCSAVNLECAEGGYTWHQFWERRFGIKPEQFDVYLDPEAVLEAKQRLAEPVLAGKPIIALSPFANSDRKSWPKRHWLELTYMLQEAGHYVYIVDGPQGNRSSMFPCMRYWGWPAKKVAALFAFTDLHIGNDSSGSHLAGLLQIPGIVISSQTAGWSIYGWYKTIETLQAPGECTECLWRFDRGWKAPCAEACMLLWDLRPKVVFEAILKRLEKEESHASAIVS